MTNRVDPRASAAGDPADRAGGGMLARLAGRTTRRAAAVALPLILVGAAFAHPGLTTTHLDLDDGGVWVTSGSDLALGRYNATVGDLTGGLLATSSELDVRQDGTEIVLVQPGSAAVVDPTTVTLTTRVDLPPDASVALESSTVLVSDPASGRAWLRPLARLATLRVDTDEPDLVVGLGGVVALDVDGVAHGLSALGVESTLRLDGDGDAQVEEVGERAASPSGSWTAATTVGETLVASDGAVLSLPDEARAVPPGGVLQAAGERADDVVVATRDALLQVPLAGGEIRSTAPGGNGLPAQPVRVGECVHAAWASPQDNYAEACDRAADAAPTVSTLDGVEAGAVPVFRVNRGRLVLNDAANGFVWLPQDSPERREPSWETIKDADDGTPEVEPEQVLVENETIVCEQDAADPLASPDQFGVRAGRTILLPVIDNDSSRACGVLAVGSFAGLDPSFGRVEPVYGGRALQLTVDPSATGSATFAYTVSDGRPTTTPAEAEVTLTVRQPHEQAAPVQVRTSVVTVEQGGSVRHDVLADFADPDGDDLRLVSATAPGGSVTIGRDGLLVVRPDGEQLGRQDVAVVVADGAQQVEGVLTIDVVAPASAPPRLGPVALTTVVGASAVLKPLDAVLSRGADPVRLASVQEVPGLSITTDTRSGVASVVASAPGSYAVPFTVVAGAQEARAIARIDVRSAQDAASALVATKDVLYLPAGGEASIDPLANDVVTPGVAPFLLDVVGPPGSPVNLAVSDHRVVTARQIQTFTQPVELTYTVTDGGAPVAGTIVVVPLPPAGTSSPPVVPDVEVTVRTGGVVTIPLLEGASDAEGDALRIEQEVVAEPADGRLYVTDRVLRYQAGETPGEFEAIATVVDSGGNRVAGRMRISVHAEDAEVKAPPRPRDLEARVHAGERVRVEVPLSGIDDDGDLVMLQGAATAPTRGRIVDAGSTWIEYEALPGESGTDTFSYAVEDWVGQRSRATVRIAVAPAPVVTNTVSAQHDYVLLPHGAAVDVPVLDNDADTGGAPLALAPELELDVPDVVAGVSDGHITIQAPDRDVVVNVLYTVTTPTGGRAQAVLTIDVRADAPVQRPVATDVVVRASETIDRTSAQVDVLAVARNPSGPLSDLTVSVPPEYADIASVTADGDVVVQLGETMRTVPYLLTSPQLPDEPGIAFVTVAALGDYPPLPRPKAPPLTVISGDRLQIEIDDHVKVAPGKTARVADAGGASAIRSDGSPLVVDDQTLQFTSAAGYAGPASVTVEIADGDPAAQGTRTSLLTFPITVLAREAYPPSFLGSSLDVAIGDAPITLDLAGLTTSVLDSSGVEQRYDFSLTGAAPAGFDVALNGSLLTVSAPVETAGGTRGTLALAIGYGGPEAVTGRVELRAVATAKPLARVQHHVVHDVAAGRPVAVELLRGAYNPFPDQPLTVTGATLVGGVAALELEGQALVVTPEAGRAQQVTIVYQVADATGDPTRVVEGSVTVTVLGPPDAPLAPTATPGDGVVDLQWPPPASNGSPITSYVVTTTPGGARTACATTVCRLTGLTNDTEYTFSVTAINAVGESPAGPPSAPVRPDVVPEAPSGLEAVRGDGTVTFGWDPALTRGSVVSSYVVEIEPGGGSVTLGGGTLAHTFTGLTNGTMYTARVKALNQRGESPWSASAGAIPAGVPHAPTGLSAPSGFRADGSTGLQVTWDPAGANGDAVVEYEVTLSGNGGSSTTLVGGTSWQPGGLVLGETYTVSVRARNGVGWSAPSGSVAARLFAPPSAPGAVSAAVATGQAPGAGGVAISWGASTNAGGNGISIAHYRVDYTTNGVPASTIVTGTSLTLSNLSGGTVVTARVTAVSSENVESTASALPGQAVALTRPEITSLTATADEDGRLDVAWTTSDGGTPLTGLQLTVDGAEVSTDVGATSWSSPTTTTTTYPPGPVHVELQVRNDQGYSATVARDPVVPEPTPTPTSTATPTEATTEESP